MHAKLWMMVFSLCVLFAPPATAADPVAESMFQNALDLMREAKFAEACPLLEASYKLEKRSGTIVVLAHCNEQINKTATAWAQYKEAAALARAEKRPAHAAKATELAKELEPRLSKLRIDAQRMQGGVELMVTLDGKVVVQGSLGVSFAVDPGDHVVAASAEGRLPWTTTVNLKPNGDAQVVAVPTLETPQAPAPSPAEVPVVAPLPQPAPPPLVPQRRQEAEVPVWAWVSGGVGLALMGAAVGFRVDQDAAAADLDTACGPDRAACPTGFDGDSLFDREQRSFGLFVGLGAAGLAGVGTAIAGIATGLSEPSTEPLRLSFTPTGLVLSGAF